MSFDIIKGDLFDLDHQFDALAQGVNTKGIMGAGIAVEFKRRFPIMYVNYTAICSEFGSSLTGLMQTHFTHQEIGPDLTGDIEYRETHIYNLFTQEFPGRNAQYQYLESAAILMRLHAEENHIQRIGMPWIGAGIGGLEKHNVQHLLQRVLKPSFCEFILVEQETV